MIQLAVFQINFNATKANEEERPSSFRKNGMVLLRTEAQAEFVYRQIYNFSPNLVEDQIVNSFDELSDELEVKDKVKS